MGLGAVAIDQLVPFHCSASGVGAEAEVELPTAKQLVALVHETPFNALDVVPPGFGLAPIDHVEPFHCSTSVAGPEAVVTLPTATQFVESTHATPPRVVSVAAAGTGIDSTDQVDPFQR